MTKDNIIDSITSNLDYIADMLESVRKMISIMRDNGDINNEAGCVLDMCILDIIEELTDPARG